METQTNTKPFYKKIWFIILIVLLVVIIIAGTITGIILGTRSSSEGGDNSGNSYIGDYEVTHLSNNPKGMEYQYGEKELDYSFNLSSNISVELHGKIAAEFYVELMEENYVDNNNLYDTITTIELTNFNYEIHYPFDAYYSIISCDYFMKETHMPLIWYEDDSMMGGIGLRYSFFATSNFWYEYSEVISLPVIDHAKLSVGDAVAFGIENTDAKNSIGSADLTMWTGHELYCENTDDMVTDTYDYDEFSYEALNYYDGDYNMIYDLQDEFKPGMIPAQHSSHIN